MTIRSRAVKKKKKKKKEVGLSSPPTSLGKFPKSLPFPFSSRAGNVLLTCPTRAPCFKASQNFHFMTIRGRHRREHTHAHTALKTRRKEKKRKEKDCLLLQDGEEWWQRQPWWDINYFFFSDNLILLWMSVGFSAHHTLSTRQKVFRF